MSTWSFPIVDLVDPSTKNDRTVFSNSWDSDKEIIPTTLGTIDVDDDDDAVDDSSNTIKNN